MAGNSTRRGAVRTTKKKGSNVGSGGNRRQGLEGKGPTPKAKDRPNHKAYKAAKTAAKNTRTSRPAPSKDRKPALDVVVGRNPVLEALRSAVPANALHIATGIDVDDRVRESLDLASELGIAIMEVSRLQIEKLAGVALHQGIALTVKPYKYADAADFVGVADVVVALDGVTDPRNLGAIVRSAAAFGAGAVIVPERRSAAMTAVAWRTSAGAAARLPVAKAVNLTRSLNAYKKVGYFLIGLAADGESTIEEAAKKFAGSPVVLVIGSEGKGISRLVSEACDEIASIPMVGGTESLNASVAASVALYAVSLQR